MLGDVFVALVFDGGRLDTAPTENDPTKVVRYAGPTRLTPRHPILQELAVSGDFEAVLSFEQPPGRAGAWAGRSQDVWRRRRTTTSRCSSIQETVGLGRRARNVAIDARHSSGAYRENVE